VVASFDEVVQEKFGTVEVDVFTAQPATPEMVRELTDRLSKTLGKQVVVHTYTEPAMIGGVKIKIGDQLLDASVAMQLSKLRDQLNRDGTAAMRSRMGNILEG
jgi:F-type H+-transporting ATPase subunit delta